MSKASRRNVDVDVVPARAKEPRFKRLRATFIALVLILVGLGVWKTYELIVIGLSMYNEHRGMVNVVMASVVVVIIVGALWYMLRAYRADKGSQRSVSQRSVSQPGTAADTSHKSSNPSTSTHASAFEDDDAGDRG